MRKVVSIALAAVAVAAVPHAGATTATGLRGTVMRGPTTPVCRVEDPCDEPAAHVTLVFSRSGADVARTTTTQRGAYRVALPAAVYGVRVASASRIGRTITPARVRVVAGRMRIVRFAIDTGIR